MSETEKLSREDLVDLIDQALDPDHPRESGEVSRLHPADLAEVLEILPPAERQVVWKHVEESSEAAVLTFLSDEVRNQIVGEMTDEEVLASASALTITDLAGVVEELPQQLSQAVIEALDADRKTRLAKVLSFEEGMAGRIMTLDVMSVREDVSLSVVLRWLRLHPDLPSHTDALSVIDDDGYYRGVLPLNILLTSSPALLVSAVMHPGLVVHAEDPVRTIAQLFGRRDLISAPVVDDDNRLIGRVTIDEVVDIIREESDRHYLTQAGLNEDEELFAPVIQSLRGRTIWLAANLLTVLLASWVISQFQDALKTLVVLAVLMPIVASMGGIAGSQTLTLTIRGMALDRVTLGNFRWLMQKEFYIGVLGGCLWSIVVALISYLWFKQIGISVVLGVAMLANLIAAGLAGITIPFFLQRIGIDPALSGAVVLTTVTDIVGFLSFLGFATLFLL